MTVNDRPFGFLISESLRLSEINERRIQRRLSDLAGQFHDGTALRSLIEAGNPVAYEVLEVRRPEREGELLCGLSILYPGLVGGEYFMTKGHYHAVRATAEIYYCLSGAGLLLMENHQGEWTAEELRPGRVVYVAPGWAHRSINTSPDQQLVTFFVYPAHAGHDYGTIETCGFRKLVLCRNGAPDIVDNPAWQGTPVAEEV